MDQIPITDFSQLSFLYPRALAIPDRIHSFLRRAFSAHPEKGLSEKEWVELKEIAAAPLIIRETEESRDAAKITALASPRGCIVPYRVPKHRPKAAYLSRGTAAPSSPFHYTLSAYPSPAAAYAALLREEADHVARQVRFESLYRLRLEAAAQFTAGDILLNLDIDGVTYGSAEILDIQFGTAKLLLRKRGVSRRPIVFMACYRIVAKRPKKHRPLVRIPKINALRA